MYNRSVDEPRPVLCVEDNDANFALIRRVLETTGRWRVSRAVSQTSRARWVQGPHVFFEAVTALVAREDRTPQRRSDCLPERSRRRLQTITDVG